MARVTSEPKYHSRARFRQTSYKDLVFAQNDFLRLVGAPNESLILIIIYYMFKYSVGTPAIDYIYSLAALGAKDPSELQPLLEADTSEPKNILKDLFRQN